jgi:hypothetical protein
MRLLRREQRLLAQSQRLLQTQAFALRPLNLQRAHRAKPREQR